ncbi:hypothetical protein SAMN05443574_11354 [Haloarcula vallismortis]|uniref:Uncharacterized protein n=2 Tax=Haloarcula vallismortis TaxID=28442 RepID=M0JNC7_HALVA|nr:hypothetical protein [Haloarcula vallismortis]EMA09868.1 hypothetical protein C437_05195 [Haloarcula vallismortis ATCC 29715]SDX06759.1 hypothetical protein SAMN05443574_11354 [Haloarcula vallismortis]
MLDCQKSRKLGAAVVLFQGVVTALFPQISVKFIKSMIGKNFDNASALEVKPAYRRQLRAVGVGMIAAAGTDLLLQSTEEMDDDLPAADEDDE